MTISPTRPSAPSHHQAHNEQDEEDKEENPRYISCYASDTSKAEHAGDNCYYQE